MEEIVARCGYRCGLCPAYYKNIENSEDRERVSAGWKKYVGDEVPPDEVTCPGCLSCEPHQDDAGNPLRPPDPDCPVRSCVEERGLENCAHCQEFCCEKLDSRMNFFQKRYQSFEGIPEEDFNMFVKPYLSKDRLLRIRKAHLMNRHTNRDGD